MQIVRSSLADAESAASYELSPEKRREADSGALDVITGFQVVDNNWRIIVAEGLADKGMKKLLSAAQRLSQNTPTLRFLANLGIRFSRRLYTRFNISLKCIRLRDTLAVSLKSPAIYDRSKVQWRPRHGVPWPLQFSPLTPFCFPCCVVPCRCRGFASMRCFGCWTFGKPNDCRN